MRKFFYLILAFILWGNIGGAVAQTPITVPYDGSVVLDAGSGG